MLVIAVSLSSSPTRVQFPSASLIHGQVVELGYTRRLERRARLGVRVRLSPWLLRVGQCSVGPHKPERPGATPGPATFFAADQVRKLGKADRPRTCEFVGSTPTLITTDIFDF